MLVLSIKQDGKIFIGDDIVVTLVGIDGPWVRLGIDAPREVQIDRESVRKAKLRKRGAALRAQCTDGASLDGGTHIPMDSSPKTSGGGTVQRFTGDANA